MPARSNPRWTGVCIDCHDAEELAAFYGGLLGWAVVADDGDGWCQLRAPDGRVGLNIQAEPWYSPPVWPEQPGRQHKMLHLEFEVDDLDEAIGRAVALGATEAEAQPPDRDPSRLRVMLDPAGHPLCLFVAGE